MKKILFFTMLALVMCLASCSSSDNGGDSTNNKNLDVTGVWKDGAYLVSFGSDYYVAYLSNKFIDTGTYAVNGKEIDCLNTYNNKKTIYKIISSTSDSLKCSVTYTEYGGQEKTEIRKFGKTTETPASKDNFLVGKSCSYSVAYYGTVTDTFSTYDIAYDVSNRGSDFKNVWYYFYLDSKIYFQRFTPTDKQYPSSTFMAGCDTGEVLIEKVISDSEGNILGYTNVDN